jgi:hypothetical protein
MGRNMPTDILGCKIVLVLRELGLVYELQPPAQLCHHPDIVFAPLPQPSTQEEHDIGDGN